LLEERLGRSQTQEITQFAYIK